MNAPERLVLPDIQSVADRRNLAIDRVGIKGVVHPVRVATSRGDVLTTIASANMYVRLPAHVKGTHMSRFIEVLQESRAALDYAGVRDLVTRTMARLDADAACVELRFHYFIEKRAPVSGAVSLLDYDVGFRGEVGDGAYRCTLRVQVPVTSLCPCSKEISDYGAHNQRSHITIAADLAAPVAIEELVAIAEQEASSEVYGLLKRPDEKYVTERAYDNPKFVEDLVRDIALRLDRDPRIVSYALESENFESIHNHSAYAAIERRRAGW